MKKDSITVIGFNIMTCYVQNDWKASKVFELNAADDEHMYNMYIDPVNTSIGDIDLLSRAKAMGEYVQKRNCSADYFCIISTNLLTDY